MRILKNLLLILILIPVLLVYLAFKWVMLLIKLNDRPKRF